MKKNNTARTVIIIIAAVLLVIVVAVLLNNMNAPKVIAYDGQGGLLENVESGTVANVHIAGGYTVYIRFKDSKYTDKQFPKKADAVCNISHRSDFEEFLQKYKAENEGKEGFVMPKVTYDDPSSSGSFTSIIFPLLSLIAMGILLFIVFRQAQGGGKAMSFAKTKARLNTNIKVRFSDVAGAEEEKEELAEIVEFLKSPKKFVELGARIPKGVLLVGPPGTGKTLFAKAVAGEANVPFFSISGSDFVEMFVGTGAARVRDLFEQAKRNMPCIIFIDEIDAVGRQRGTGLGGGHDEREQTLNQLLVQMDGFDKNEGIIIMAATNRSDILDPALLRPGRFDRQIYVNPPDVKGREEILKVHSRNKPLAADVNFKVLARITSGFTGADIENLLNEASILAARANRRVIIMEDILEGINKVIAGPQKRSRVVTETDKRITAYHEAGHAILARVLDNCDDVQEVSIIPRGLAAGYTITRPDNDDNHLTRAKLLDNITMMLGGRAAEELVIHDVSTGASNDIQRASAIARSMVTEWGMSEEIGTMFLGGSQEIFLGRDYQTQHNFSEQMSGRVDAEVKKILDICYKKSIEIIRANRGVMDNMVKVLYEKETIYNAEVEMLFNGESAAKIIAKIDDRQNANESYRKNNNPPAKDADAFAEVNIAEEKTVMALPQDNGVDNSDGASDKSADKEDCTVKTDAPTGKTDVKDAKSVKSVKTDKTDGVTDGADNAKSEGNKTM